MINSWVLIISAIVFVVVCTFVGFSIDMHFNKKTNLAEDKLIDIDNLKNLKNTNTGRFIIEAEYILKYLKNKCYSEFHEFRYGKSKHNKGYYIVGYTNRTNSKRYFPCHNIMGNYGYPDYYLKDIDEVRIYYIDLLWKELNYMLQEKIKWDEYESKKEL